MKNIIAAILMLTSMNIAADVIYSEDFSSDPGITSLAPNFSYWDSNEENYYLETYRNSNEKYWAYKDISSFRTTELDTVSVDIYYETLNQLTYPSFRFYEDEPTDISSLSNPYGVGFSQYNCCGNANRFVVFDGITGSRQISTNHITSGVWYNILMHFSSDLTFDALVTERDSGSIILDAQDLVYADTIYNFIGMGYYTDVPPNTGPTTMLIDNIHITSVPEPAPLVLFCLGFLGLSIRRKLT